MSWAKTQEDRPSAHGVLLLVCSRTPSSSSFLFHPWLPLLFSPWHQHTSWYPWLYMPILIKYVVLVALECVSNFHKWYLAMDLNSVSFPPLNTWCLISILVSVYTHLCCSVAKLCLTLRDPMDYSTSGSSVLHFILEFAGIHDHWVGDAV